MLTIEQVKPYIWPHYDFGKSQGICSRTDLKHGEVVEFKQMIDGKIKITKATFRLLEAGLYRDDWMAEALPLAKKYFESKC